MAPVSRAPLPEPGWFRHPALWVCLLVLGLHALWLAGVAEDAFIAFRFARHLAEGHGLVWNPGEPPVEGYTNFLWVLIAAAVIRLGGDAPAVMPLVGLAAAAVTLARVYRFGLRRLGFHRQTALVPALLLAVAGPFAGWAPSGMETLLFTLFTWLAFEALVEAWQDGRRSLGRVALWACLAALTRPEGVLVAGVLLGTSAVLSLRTPGAPSLAAHLGAAAWFASAFAAYFAWRLQRYGYLLPLPFYAKTGGGLAQVTRGGLLTTLFVVQFLVPLVPWLVMLAWDRGSPSIAAVAGQLRRRGRLEAAAFAATFTIAWTIYATAVGGDYMAMHRFFVVVLPFCYVLLGCAIDPLATATAHEPWHRPGLRALIAWSVCATIVHSTPIESRLFAKPDQQHGNYQGVATERWNAARLALIGRFFDDYRRRSDETLATGAIGAVGYYAHLRILDLTGLAEPHIALRPAPPGFGRGLPGHERSDLAYVLSRRPTYLMLTRALLPEPVRLEDHVPPALRADVARDYENVTVWLDDRVNHQAGYFTFLARRAPDAVADRRLPER